MSQKYGARYYASKLRVPISSQEDQSFWGEVIGEIERVDFFNPKSLPRLVKSVKDKILRDIQVFYERVQGTASHSASSISFVISLAVDRDNYATIMELYVRWLRFLGVYWMADQQEMELNVTKSHISQLMRRMAQDNVFCPPDSGMEMARAIQGLKDFQLKQVQGQRKFYHHFWRAQEERFRETLELKPKVETTPGPKPRAETRPIQKATLEVGEVFCTKQSKVRLADRSHQGLSLVTNPKLHHAGLVPVKPKKNSHRARVKEQVCREKLKANI